ncbi:transporter [Propioniciclava sp. MC1683]|uniref:aspartate:alanine exchanger family transporter n=1 Tax=Propioniciclava sp. MC1683 TaxID=2760309 RepID=UPI0016008CBC|nr:TrkA C-terminal domain-containing protein [Propioniciclava sp. MC1683]MBB1501155.1 transporter [Propioniciclava sp. MC1683]
MHAVLTWLAEHPEVLLFALVGAGMAVGHVTVRKISLGAAAVLFVAIAVSALGASQGVALEIPVAFAHLGLALFTFSVGVSSGAAFFNSLRTQAVAMVGVALAIVLGGAVAFTLGPLLGLTVEEAAGTFAGAVTNTPALAAAGNTPAATVGYSVAYLLGVLGMLVVQQLALRHAAEDADAPAPLTQVNVRVEHIAPGTTVRDLEELHGDQISVTRVRHEEEGPVALAYEGEELKVDDVITVVGPDDVVAQLVGELGHKSSHHLVHDRALLDFRRVTVSDPHLSGRTVAELGLEEKFGATVSRVRRADVDMVAKPGFVLQVGDRVRVVAPRSRIVKVSEFFGDSSRGLTIINPIGLGLGMALGFALGSVPLPLPGGGTFTLGSALCCLLVGLVFGRLGRIGPLVTTLPFTATAVISELGLLLFLAQAGARAGGQILDAFAGGQWLAMLGLGVLITATVGLSVYAFQRTVMRMGGTALSGLLAGAQTQPALLAYANEQTNHDFRVASGYTTAYPTAMITKILVASVLGLLA